MMTKRAREHGQDLIEFALVLPILMLILMAILDLGRAVYYYSAIHNSAREGARYGIIYPDSPDDIIAVVQNFAIGLDPNELTITVTTDEETVHVNVTYTFTPVTPIVGALLGSNTVTLGSDTVMRIEG